MEWLYVLGGVTVVLLLCSPLIAAQVRSYQLSQAGLARLEHMTLDGFVTHLNRLFSAMGYRVQRQKEEDAARFDLLLTDGLGHKRGVVARYWRKPVDEVDVQAVVKDLQTLGDHGTALIITLEFFTSKAKRAVESEGIYLWGLSDLAKAVSRVMSTALVYPDAPAHRAKAAAAASGETAPEPVAENPKEVLFARPMPVGRSRRRGQRINRNARSGASSYTMADGNEVPLCPKCNRKMMLRVGQYGEYWGCTAAPRCLGTRVKLD